MESRFTVSGPGLEERAYPQPGPALSAAITFACRRRDESTFYVRDVGGDAVGRVENDGRGGISVYRLRGFYRLRGDR